MLHVDYGTYLLTSPPVTHHHTYTETSQSVSRTIGTPLDDWGFETSSGYVGYQQYAEPSPNPNIYSSVSFIKTDGTTTQHTQAAESDGSRTVYYRYVDGVKNASAPSYDVPGEYTILLSSWGYNITTGVLSGMIRVEWRYKGSGGTYGTAYTNSQNVVLRQGDGAQTEYTYHVTETIS